MWFICLEKFVEGTSLHPRMHKRFFFPQILLWFFSDTCWAFLAFMSSMLNAILSYPFRKSQDKSLSICIMRVIKKQKALISLSLHNKKIFFKILCWGWIYFVCTTESMIWFTPFKESMREIFPIFSQAKDACTYRWRVFLFESKWENSGSSLPVMALSIVTHTQWLVILPIFTLRYFNSLAKLKSFQTGCRHKFLFTTQ